MAEPTLLRIWVPAMRRGGKPSLNRTEQRINTCHWVIMVMGVKESEKGWFVRRKTGQDQVTRA